jgi:hypothetical protein
MRNGNNQERFEQNNVVLHEFFPNQCCYIKGALNIMSKIIAINAGSSSLKFQLFQMPSEDVITKGLIERIGLNDSVFNITVNGEKNPRDQ